VTPWRALWERLRASRFFSGNRAVNGQLRLDHQRIFILPSRRGVGFCVLIGLLLLIGFVYGNNLIYALAFWLAGVFFVTILNTFKMLYGLVLRLGAAQPVFAGEYAVFPLRLDNASTLPREGLYVETAAGRSPMFSVATSAAQSVPLRIPTLRRGWQPLGKITVFSRYPLGLFHAWSPVVFEARVLVYPAPAPTGVALPESTPDSGTATQQMARGSDDFYGLQTYQAGDSIKHIHWQAYAKGLGVFSKHYRGGGSAEIWLDLAQTPGGDLENRLSVLCRWVLEAERAGLRYGCKLGGLQLPPAQGAEQARRCLEALALYGQ